ncbi:hypothetical protein MPSI1_001590 [Malassezia psittaci]|uniref:Uncharacterized protein n=1 Tax=Malassezia psittaci TaxID=1821823 RepID=A0AAF0F9R7_9BASI|nr:hypothetical protein MPSI1_001590 [Malassezia psittaci]
MVLDGESAEQSYNEQVAWTNKALQQRVNQAQADASSSEKNNLLLQSYIESINKNLASKTQNT